MPVHGQTMTWGVGIGMKAPAGSSGWLRRLQSWVRYPTRRYRVTVPPVEYAYWDGRREQFRQPTTDAALDQAIAQLGPSWAIMLYGSLL
jgi:hypothetical protein